MWTPRLESARVTRVIRALSMSDCVVEKPDSHCAMGNSQEDDMIAVRLMNGRSLFKVRDDSVRPDGCIHPPLNQARSDFIVD